MTDQANKNRPGEQVDNDQLFSRQQTFVESSQSPQAPIIIVTGIRTPENMGSILRHADAVGCNRVIFVESENMATNKKMSRIARSADKHIQIDYLTREQFFKSIRDLPELIALEITTTSKDIFSSELPRDCCFIVGSERYGIAADILQRCRRAVHIPMYGINASMNVSHALTVALFEWRRQHPQ